MQVGMGFWASKTLLSAVELGVFSTLANAPADLPTLQRKLALHRRSARDFLDALVALKLLERVNGIYSNTVDTDQFLDRAKPSYIDGVLEMANARLYGFWGSLTEALRTGELLNESKGGGEDIFAALYADPEQLRGFLSAMSGVSAGAAHAIAANFPWRDYKTFMDLGSAQGMVPATLARAHPHLTGIGFDLPPVKSVFEEFIAHGHRIWRRMECHLLALGILFHMHVSASAAGAPEFGARHTLDAACPDMNPIIRVGEALSFPRGGQFLHRHATSFQLATQPTRF
jgi:hypothetical protein